MAGLRPLEPSILVRIQVPERPLFILNKDEK